jgi:hypothetical protein
VNWRVFAAALLAGGIAHAQPSAADVSRAVSLFDDAKRALAAGDTPEACHLFVESYRLDPQVGTLLNTALCHEKAGRNASAWAEFTTVVSLASRAGQAKRADFARTHVHLLEPKLVRVRFTVEDRDDALAMTVDGDPISMDAVRAGPVPMDPGAHELVVTAPKKKPWHGSITVPSSGDGGSQTIPHLEDEARAPTPAPIALPPPPSPPPPETSPLRTAAWITAVAGGVGLVAGGVGGFLAMSAQSTADEHCSNGLCLTPDAQNANDRAFTFATVSTVGFIVGAALAATSVVLFLVSTKSSH